MKKLLIFAGTTEGRIFSRLCAESNFAVTVSVATEYGKILEEHESKLFNLDNLKILQARLSQKEMEEILCDFDAIIDATHPFALEVSKNIRNACENKKIPYFRLLRQSQNAEITDSLYEFDSLEELSRKLFEFIEKNPESRVFISTGSKELECFKNLPNFPANFFIRILPSVESIQKCIESGFLMKQIIAMQGPFSVSLNEAFFRECGASVLVTKESGKTGGFDEKISAARNCGMKIFCVRRPKETCEVFEDMNKLLNVLKSKISENSE